MKRISIKELVICSFVFLTSFSSMGNFVMKINRVFVVGFALLWIIYFKKIRWNLYLNWITGFLIYAGITLIYATTFLFAKNMFITLLINAICMFSLWQFVDDDHLIDKIIIALFLGGVFFGISIYGVYGLTAYYLKIAPVHRNQVGMVCGYCFLLALYFYCFKEKWKKLSSFCAIINAIWVILTGSKQGLLIILLSILSILIIRTKMTFKSIISISIIGTIVFCAIMYLVMEIPFFYSLLGHRIQMMFLGLFVDPEYIDGSTETRLSLILYGLDWFTKRPWFGYGVDNYRFILHSLNPNAPIGYYAHNNYVELLVDTGVFGIVLYYSMYVYLLLKASIQKKNEEVKLIICGILILMINEMVRPTYYDKFIYLYLMVLFLILRKNIRQSHR